MKYERVEPCKISRPRDPNSGRNAPSIYAYRPQENTSKQLLALVEETIDTRETHQSEQSLLIYRLKVDKLYCPS